MTDELIQPVERVPEKKRRINSKKKGSGFEGGIAKQLGDKLAPMKFRRSQSSGAILGGKNAKSLELFSDDAKTLFIGDVVPTNESDVIRTEGWKLKFTIECKFYRDPDDLDHMHDPRCRILGWYEEAQRDAAKLNKQPLLIFKFNRSQTFVGLQAPHPLPTTLSFVTTMHRITGDKPLELRIFLLEEAFLDLEWWKVRELA